MLLYDRMICVDKFNTSKEFLPFEWSTPFINSDFILKILEVHD